jgi:folate-binding protein YgfZ
VVGGLFRPRATPAAVMGRARGGVFPAATLTAQGRALALFALYETGENLWVATTAARSAATRAALSRFLVADDCEFGDDIEARSIAVAGPRAAEVLRAAGVEEPPAEGSWEAMPAVLAGESVVVCSRGDLRVPWYEVLCADLEGQACDAPSVAAALEAAGAKPCGTDAVEILRVESGTPRFGVDVDEKRIAMEARLEWAIHFAKGCYVGQEVIERAVSRGRLQHELALLALDGEVASGARIAGAGENDVVTSVTVSPRLGRLALAYLPKSLAETGSIVSVEPLPGANAVAATVLAWPRPRVLPGRS